MSLETMAAANAAAIFDMHGLAATYTTVAGVSSSISVIKQDGQSFAERDWQTSNARSAEIQVQKADIAAPAPNDKITIGSDTYTVRGLLPGSSAVWVLACEIHG